MRRFVLHIILPLLLIICIVLAACEVVMRVVPNEYRYKSSYMDKNAERVKILVLGSSGTNRGIRPAFFTYQPAFSCAGSSQDLQNDCWILHHYLPRMDSLRYVVLNLNYLTMLHNIDYEEDHRALWAIYHIYYDNPHYDAKWWQNAEISRFNWMEALKYVTERDTLRPDGSMSPAAEPYNDSDWRHYAEAMAEYHTRINTDSAGSLINANTLCLKEIICACLERNINVILLTCPEHHYYRDALDRQQLALMWHVGNNMQAKYPNVRYIDLSADPNFDVSEMVNANHLNGQGAIKLTLMLNDSISKWEHPTQQ